MRAGLGDEALWARMLRYADRRGGALDHDLKGALKIGMMTGHWQGQGEPCDLSFSLNVCGSRNGLGGDLIGARNAVNSTTSTDRGRHVASAADVPGADPAVRPAQAER